MPTDKTIHTCPLFDGDRASRIQSGVDSLGQALMELNLLVTDVKVKQEFWLGNGKPGEVRHMREMLDDHQNYIVAARAAEKAGGNVWSSIRSTVIPVIASIMGALAAIHFGRH